MKLRILTYPDDAVYLRSKCHPVYHTIDREKPVGTKVGPPMSYLQDISRDLIDTLQSTSGVGLAANQVRYCVRVFVMNRFPARDIAETTFIDPVYTIPAMCEKNTMCEGCLSVPNIGCGIPIVRHSMIDINYIDIDGYIRSERLVGIEAQIAQHEIDHLNGVLIIDTDHPTSVIL